MKINWKVISRSPGYKSLKAVYVHDVQDAHRDSQRSRKPMRDKAEFRKKFNWIIQRAIHYAYHKYPQLNITVALQKVLHGWETNRNYWWLNYYQDGQQPQFNSKCLKPVGSRGMRKYCKKHGYSFSKYARDYILKKQKKKAKPRWSMTKKKDAANIRR